MTTPRDTASMLKLFEAYIEGLGSLRAAARRWRLSAAYLSDIRHGKREPGPKLLKAMKLRKSVDVVRTVRYHDV